MRILAWLLSCTLVWSVSGAETHFDFGEDPEGTTLTNFQAALLGSGAPPAWKIISAEVPSGFAVPGSKAPLLNPSTVLAQTSRDMTDEHYPMYIYDGATFDDFKFSTRFSAVSGVAEQMAGLVFRYQNPSNFDVVRISVLGKNIACYKVVNGEIVSPYLQPLQISAGSWHTLEVDCSGIYVDCLVDGQDILKVIPDKLTLTGKIGFWTKSDAVTYFADATVDYTPRIPAAQEMINEMMEKRPKLLGLQIYTLTPTNTTRVLASKNISEVGQPGTEAELLAIQNGTVSLGREHGAVLVTLPLHDRNGEYIGAVRVKLKSFFGETQDNAVTRARMVQKDLEQLCPSAESLRN
jgi:hypothetical protein